MIVVVPSFLEFEPHLHSPSSHFFAFCRAEDSDKIDQPFFAQSEAVAHICSSHRVAEDEEGELGAGLMRAEADGARVCPGGSAGAVGVLQITSRGTDGGAL